MSPERTAMTSVDRAWLRMDTAENPMMISGVLILEHPVSIKRLRRTLEERFLKFHRFRQRVVNKGDRAYWQDDPMFDLDNHLHCIALPGKAGKTELQALASDLNSTSLDFRRPLWQMHYIDNYHDGAALLVRIHHCIADGISLARVLMSLTDRTPEPKLERIAGMRKSATPGAGATSRLLHRLVDSGQTGWQQAKLFVSSVREEPNYPLKLATAAGGIAMDLIKLGFAPSEPDTSLKRQLVGRKKVGWAEPLVLTEVKQCAKILRGTVNDVLLCVATGALSRHFTEQQQPVPECGIRVAVPFNLRPLDQPIDSLGNQFGMVLVNLPIEVMDPIMCFRQVRENMNRLKRSYQAQVTYSLLDLFGRGPDILERRALDMLSNKASAVLTNVPGPRHPVYLAGSKLIQPMFWVPQSGNIGIGMSIFSYADTVQFGITIDKGIPAEPEAVMKHFKDSFQALYQAALTEEHSRDIRHAS